MEGIFDALHLFTKRLTNILKSQLRMSKERYEIYGLVYCRD